MAQFSVCTYNVHMFYDGRGNATYDQIVRLLTELKPDVLCLQVDTMGIKGRSAESSV